ncbi:hypothetical protein CN587_16360 [Bacillus wiedmannii]|nr:hypothetical protein CN562_01445 [Bacillus wiedmannii]PEQ04085.1 hypothetical protein CN587_16360 [Bacillus wiedmannii]
MGMIILNETLKLNYWDETGYIWLSNFRKDEQLNEEDILSKVCSQIKANETNKEATVCISFMRVIV